MLRNILPPTTSQTGRDLSPLFLTLTVLFCVCLIVANLLEIKVVNLGLLTITAGVVVFPLSYILNDCIVEVYGYHRARLVIWIGFGANFLVSVLLQIGIWLPGSDSWHHQEAMSVIFGAAPRIFAASFIAFLCGSIVNAYVMARLKARDGRRRFGFRAIVSSLWGEGVDSVIFFPIAFGGILAWGDILWLIITQTMLKTAYEIVILPVTVRVVRLLRVREQKLQSRSEHSGDFSR